MRNTTKLRQIVGRRQAALCPGAPNALFAWAIEAAGFDCAYVTGAGVANMQFGVPDIGLTTMTDMAEVVRAIAGVVDLPLIVDGDTGFGNALNTYRTVQVFERAGASAIQLEDQVFPKRCGHFSGKAVIPVAEMVQKVRAAVDARRDADFMIIARTDALAIDGLEAAIDRAHLFIEAGADMTFVEAPVDEAQMRRIAQELPVPQVANIVFGGKTPEPGVAGLAEMGFGLSLYANAILQAALKSVTEVLDALKADGSLSRVADRLASFETRQLAVAKDLWDAREARYSLPPTAPGAIVVNPSSES